MPGDALNLIVADDEPLARELVRGYVERDPDMRIVDECANTTELTASLARQQADVALLDVRMPGPSVFEVLARLSESGVALPFVIFATAYDSYAVRAFEMNAVDYLVKPFSEARFAEAIRRVRERRPTGQPAAALAGVIRDLGPRPDRLLVPDGGRMVPIAVSDILWIEAERDYVRLHTAAKSYLVSRSLKEMEARLDPSVFVRIHRSAIVHASHIREVRPQGSSRYRVILSNGAALVVSRTRAPELRRWIL